MEEKIETTSKYGFRRAASIRVPEEFFNPLKTGIKDVDMLFSEIGGIIPSQATFITGKPGAGKTTLTLAIAAALSHKEDMAFISLEMSDFQLAHQARKIPGFGGVHVASEFHQKETLKFIAEMQPKLVILDSIQKAARSMKLPDGKPMPFNTAQYEIVNMFTKFAKETWTPVFLIGHCDKSGNYKGPSDLLHDVDSHLLVNYDADTDIRSFVFGKNRFGGLIQESLFGITSSTVWIGTPLIADAYPKAKFEVKEPGEDDDYNLGNIALKPLEEEPAGKAEPPSAKEIGQFINLLENQWDGTTARVAITQLIEYLKTHDTEFANKSIIKDASKVKVIFGGTSISESKAVTGEMTFGRRMFTATLKSEYAGFAKEQKYMHPRVKSKPQLMVWLILHEWCHLYQHMDVHNNTLFELVARKFDWLSLELGII